MGIYKKHVTATEFNETASLRDMKIKTIDDGSTWARIHWLDVIKDTTYFTADTADFSTEVNRFSRLKFVDKFASSMVTLTNLAPEINGVSGFPSNANAAANGNEGWRKYSDASLQLTGTTSAAETTLQSSSNCIPLVNGNKYYVRVEIKQSAKVGTAQIYLGGTSAGSITEPSFFSSKAVSAASTWTVASGVNTRTFPTGNHKFRLDFDNSKNAGTMCFDGLVIIDLTKCFGAGKEPTQAWCDANIPYFQGTITVDAANMSYKRWEFMLTYPHLNLHYNRLDYIASSGTQFINTGVTTNQDTKIEITASYTGAYSVYGAGQAYTNFTANASGGYFYYNGYDGGSSPIINYANNVHVFTQDKNVCYVDGVKVHTFTAASFTSPGNLFLFCRNNGSGGLNDAGGTVKIYSCKIYNNGTLIRDYVPCRLADGQIGLMDLLNKTFYGNAGTGTFTAGTVLYPTTLEKYNRWTQTDSPTGTAPGGYTPITTAWPAHAGALRKNNGGDAVYNCDNVGSTTWYAAIGQKANWSGGIPAADGTSQKETELWVRVDNLGPSYRALINEGNSMIGNQFYEY